MAAGSIATPGCRTDQRRWLAGKIDRTKAGTQATKKAPASRQALDLATARTDALVKADLWRHYGVRLIIADMGLEPVTENGPARLFFGMLALVAEFERDRILERTIEGRRAKKANGGHVGGSAPFGFRKEGTGKEARLVKIPEQQAALKTINALRGRMSLRGVAAQVMERHGIPVSHVAVRRILRATKALI